MREQERHWVWLLAACGAAVVALASTAIAAEGDPPDDAKPPQMTAARGSWAAEGRLSLDGGKH